MRPAWTRLPPRRITAVAVEPGRGRVLQLECGHQWQTRRVYVVGQRIRCVLCSSEAWSTVRTGA